MAADWSQPTLTTAYATFLSALLARDVDSTTMFQGTGTSTNIPDKAVRWNPTNSQFEVYSSSGGTWSQLWSGGINVPSATVANAPTAAGHATRKDYVDAGDAAAKAASVPLAGGTMGGALTLAYASPSLTLNAAAAGQQGMYALQTAGVMRWRFGKNLDAESGSNVGSSFAINGYSDAGALIGTVLSIARATGVCSLMARPTWAGYTPWDSNNLTKVSQLSNDVGYITTGGVSDSALAIRNGGNAGGTRMVFNWAGQGGQPSWLLGSNDGANFYAYNPAVFSVAYAASAGAVNGVTNPANTATTWGTPSTSLYGPARALGTNYTNSTGRPMIVHIVLSVSGSIGGNPPNLIAYVSGNMVDACTPGDRNGSNYQGQYAGLSFAVPAGATYNVSVVSGSAPTINSWIEEY